MLSSGAAKEPRGLWFRESLPPLERWGLEGEELGMGWDRKLLDQEQNSGW